MNHGWIKLHRCLFSSSMWTNEVFTRAQAWIDLIGLANYQDGFIRIQGIKVDVLRGELAISEENLAIRWKWSRGKVRRFLQELRDEAMITKENHAKQDRRKAVITILNYEKYQSDEKENGTGDGTGDGTTLLRKKEVKKERKKEIKPKTITLGEFENVFLSEEELEKLKEKYNGTLNQKIEALSSYMASQGKKYASHYATILAWDRKNNKGGNQNAGETDEQRFARLSKLLQDGSLP